ncbi:MAG: hypothetical protein WAT39_25300, partial [Planctomycetota bacterium]
MTESGDSKPPFQLQVGYDQDELLGARWWQEGLQASYPRTARRPTPSTYDEGRRTALKALVALGGFGVVAALAVRCSSGSSGGGTVIDQASLDLQRQKGLATGAEQVAFAWPDAVATTAEGTPLADVPLADLAADLRPARGSDQPDYVPTLFQCFGGPGGDAFRQQFRLVQSDAMAKAFARGDAVRELFDVAAQRQQWGLVIDLPGPESVAFAAGLLPRVVPVFTFGNWPHPRGVVPAHLTLAAAVFHRRRFVDARSDEPQALAWVLDRNRLGPYANEPDRFDNRYAVALPSGERLRQRQIQRVLYVVPDGAPSQELDDLTATFAAWQRSGIGVRMLGLQDVTLASPPAVAAGAASSPPRYYWHGSPAHHFWFWNHYGWPS